jgi:hypothetical protein
VRILRILTITILLIIIFLSLAHVFAILNIPRHIDPSTAPEEISYEKILYLMSMYSEHISKKSFVSAQDVIKIFNEIYLPPNIREMFKRVTDVINKINDNLSYINSLLESVERYIQQGSLVKANETLNMISTKFDVLMEHMIQLNDLVKDLRSRNMIIGSGLEKIFININNTYNDLLKKYYDLRSKLEYLSSSGLIDTKILLDVEPREIETGDHIKIEGFLLDEYERPLNDRTLSIHIGENILYVKTDSKGFFSLIHRVLVYKNYIDIYAEYVPSEADRETYKYCRSDVITIHILYTRPVIKIFTNVSKILPGRTLSIDIESDTPVYINLTSPLINITSYYLNYSTTFFVKIPENISEGVYYIKVSSYPNGSIAPSEAMTSILIYRSDIEIMIIKPDFILIPSLSNIIEIIPSINSTININSPNDVSIEYLGDYKYRIDIPLHYIYTYVEFDITILPEDPGYKTAYLSLIIPVYNIFVMISGVSIIAVVAFIGLKRYKKVVSQSSVIYEEPVKYIASYEEKRSFESSDIPLLSQLITLIEKITSTVFSKELTYREYLEMIRLKIFQPIYEVIKNVFLKIEGYVYGGPRYKYLSKEINASVRELIVKLKSLVEERS